MHIDIVKNVGQNTLEMCLVLILGTILLVGAVSVWNWFNKTMTERLDSYKASRHSAADTHSSDIGKQVNYTPEELDIFALTSGLKDAPAKESATVSGDADYQHCYDAYYAAINQSQILINESVELAQESAGLMQEFMDLKMDLGVFEAIRVWSGGGYYSDRIDQWLFGDAEKYYKNTWDEINLTFTDRVEAAAESTLYMLSFEDASGNNVKTEVIYNDYINEGVRLENQSEEAMQDSINDKNDAQALQEQAPKDLTECLGGAAPEEDPCTQGCETNYGDALKQKSEEAQMACASGDMDNCDKLTTELGADYQQYSDCIEGCGSPCVSDCKDKYKDDYDQKNQEAQDACYADPDSTECKELSEQALEISKQYNNCLMGCE